MKFREIFRFEFGYQVRRLPTWLYFIVITAIAFLQIRGNYLADALYDDFFINSPFIIAMVTVFGSIVWLLIAASVAGEAAARDVQTGMYSLTYTSPVKKLDYLGGRLLAALLVNALVLFGVPLGIILAVYLPGVETEVIGPFRPVAYITAYGFIALPGALVTTALQFSFAALNGRIKAAYLGSMIVFISAYIVAPLVAIPLGQKEFGKLLDPIGTINIVSRLATEWTPAEKSSRLLSIEGTLAWNRMFWISIGLVTFALTYLRFQFAYRITSSWWKRRRNSSRKTVHPPVVRSAITIPNPPRTFGMVTRLRQGLTIAWTSFRIIAKTWSGLFVWAIIAALIVLTIPLNLHIDNVPLLPRTDYLLTILAAPLTNVLSPWVIIPLMIMLYAGELIWREREAGISEITDAAGVPDWVLFLGKFSGLALALAVWMGFMIAAILLVQAGMGYKDHQIGLLLQVFLGFQLIDYLLFALLAMMVQVAVNQKYIGHLITLIVYVFIGLSAQIGIHEHLLVYASGPRWSYSEMRGFGPSLGPWIWFRLYWMAWALLLAVITRLLWVRSKEADWRVRMQLARRRFTGATATIGLTSIVLTVIFGGYIFYNTNVLNHPAPDNQADYERKYSRFKNVPQPQLTGVKLQVEIYPAQRKAHVKGTYLLVNNTATAIDTLHIENAAAVKTTAITFNKPTTHVVNDEALRHHIYVLAQPLQPGDSLQMNFDVQFERNGFTNNGISPAVIANGTYFTNEDWFPVIGYQQNRELIKPAERRRNGLAARPLLPSPYDVDAGNNLPNKRISFEAIMGTDNDQVAVAPGILQKTWTKNGRKYYQYAADAPISNEYALFSAKYAVYESRWKDVAIKIYYHPGHGTNVKRIVHSTQATLEYCSHEYGAYPYKQVTFVEHPGHGPGMHAETAMITFEEGFSQLNPKDDPKLLDFPFAVVSHEVSHQWWGGQLPYAYAGGAGLLTESPAWYTAMRVINKTYGKDHVQQLHDFFHQPYPILPIKPSVPLLRSFDPYGAYRKGPFALHALSAYMGEERVNLAYNRLVTKYRSGDLPPATSLDLYKELKAVTPDSLQTLLQDYFEANTFWNFKMERAAAEQTASGAWKVTMEMTARKTVVSEAGTETELPMTEWVEIGVFGTNSKPLYLQKHRVRSGRQEIVITVPDKPGPVGVDPFNLLFDWKPEDNSRKIH